MALRNKRTVIAGAVVLLLLLVFVPLPSLTLKGKGAVRSAMAPAEHGSSGLLQRLSAAAAAIRGIGGAVEESRDLSRENLRLKTELNRLRDAESDNTRLHKALDFYQQQPDKMIPCDVVSRNISGWWNSVRIGKGYKAGIALNLAVISLDGLVGKTTDVTPYTTEVLLISDPACQVSAKIKRNDVYGLVRGTGSNAKGEPRARIEFINKDKPVRVNDEVVTSGLGAFPKGVHIGYVNKVETDESGLFQYAEIIPSATAGLLDYVFVVAPSPRKEQP